MDAGPQQTCTLYTECTERDRQHHTRHVDASSSTGDSHVITIDRGIGHDSDDTTLTATPDDNSSIDNVALYYFMAVSLAVSQVKTPKIRTTSMARPTT